MERAAGLAAARSISRGVSYRHGIGCVKGLVGILPGPDRSGPTCHFFLFANRACGASPRGQHQGPNGMPPVQGQARRRRRELRSVDTDWSQFDGWFLANFAAGFDYRSISRLTLTAGQTAFAGQVPIAAPVESDQPILILGRRSGLRGWHGGREWRRQPKLPAPAHPSRWLAPEDREDARRKSGRPRLFAGRRLR